MSTSTARLVPGKLYKVSINVTAPPGEFGFSIYPTPALDMDDDKSQEDDLETKAIVQSELNGKILMFLQIMPKIKWSETLDAHSYEFLMGSQLVYIDFVFKRDEAPREEQLFDLSVINTHNFLVLCE